jgi:hypothetical protein
MVAEFQSDKTLSALQVVGFYPKYGQINDDEWTFRVDSLTRDDAVDATGRLLNAMLLQAFPEWECALMDQDIQRLHDAIANKHGPFGNDEVSSAMMRVKIGSQG